MKRNKTLWLGGLVTLAVLAFLLGACGPKYMEAMPEQAATAPQRYFARAASSADADRLNTLAYGAEGERAEPKRGKGQSPGGMDLGLLAASRPDRYLIKDATMTVEVEDARLATDALVALVQAAGGYVGRLNEMTNAVGVRSVVMQVRVPATEFDQTMRQLEPLGKVLHKQVSTADVTEEFVDTEAKLRNLKATEERILDHLNRTAELEEILLIEAELNRYREQIERLEGRLRFLGDRVSFSTIDITLQEQAKAHTVVPPKTFSTGQVFTEATRSLVAFAQRVWARAIWIGVWSAVWLPLVLIALAVAWRVRRMAKRTTRRPHQDEPEP